MSMLRSMAHVQSESKSREIALPPTQHQQRLEFESQMALSVQTHPFFHFPLVSILQLEELSRILCMPLVLPWISSLTSF